MVEGQIGETFQVDYSVTNTSAQQSQDIRLLTDAPTVIPDSVVLQYYGNTWTQGDSSWKDDIGSANMSLSGDFQDATLSDGNESILGDGTDDVGVVTLPSTLEGADLEQASFEFAVEFTDTSLTALCGSSDDDDNQWFAIRINSDENFNNDAGQIMVRYRDKDGNGVRFSPSSNPNLDDGNRHNISFVVNDSTVPDTELIIDGTSVSLNYASNSVADNWGTWDNNFRFWAYYRGTQGTDLYSNVEIGAIRFHNEAISSQTIGDY